jgi:predicted nuclease with RNAse H fold
VITAGVDLATEAARTALALIRWDHRVATVTSVVVGVEDVSIVRMADQVDVVGVDCPLGWPDDFVDFLAAHHRGARLPPSGLVGVQWRRRLAYRASDRAVHRACGLTPLSVAADRIGLTAMRAAGLLAHLAEAGHAVDRSGEGVVVEVYPAASLKIWGLSHRRYKRPQYRAARETLLNQLADAAPWLDLGDHADLCVESDDAFDAVIAALTARAKALGDVTAPANGTERAQARREGWILLPTRPLSALISH